jgi:hypothetical protein
MRDDFSKDTIRIVAQRVNYLCSCPTCRCLTISASNRGIDKTSLIGEASHICAASKGGKRYDPNMTSGQRKSIENCIWLCENHAKLIDTDEQKYTIDLLKQWKSETENYVQQAIELTQKQSDNAIYLCEEWFEKFLISSWDKITENLLRPFPMMNEFVYEKFLDSNIWLSKNIHNIKDPGLNMSIVNFSNILITLLDKFIDYTDVKEISGRNIYITTPYRYHESLYKNVGEYNEHEKLIYELGFELTKAINYICKLLRENYNCSFAKEKINLLFSTNILEGFQSFIPEYMDNENRQFVLDSFLEDKDKRLFS